MTIRVAIVDDQALVRDGLRHDPRRPARHRGRRRRRRRRLGVELVPADATRRRADGHPHARARRHRGHPADPRTATAPTEVLVLTTFDLDEYVYAALRAGASGFLLKDAPAEELVAAVRVSPPARRCCRRRSPAADRGVRTPARAGRRPRRSLPTPHRPRAGGARLLARGCRNARDRGAHVHRRSDRQDARQPAADEARRARPRAGGRARLRIGPRATRPGNPRVAVNWCLEAQRRSLPELRSF